MLKMDENLAWKSVLIAAFFSLIMMGIVYLFISPQESPYFTEEKTEKIAEFKNTRISGRREGKKIWELFAKEGWTSKNREVNYLYNVSKGKIFMDGELVVTDLVAPWAKAFRNTDVVEVFGFPEGKKTKKSLLRAKLDLRKISTKKKDYSEWTRIKADYLQYVPKQKRSEMRGNVELHKKDSSIYAQHVLIDHQTRKAEMSDGVRIRRADGTLSSDLMHYFGPEEKLSADGHVDLKISEHGLKTSLKANHANFYSDMSREMTLQGNLEAAQGKKLAVADSGIYSQKRKTLAMKGNAKAVFAKAKVILKEASVRKLKSREAKDILKEKTVLTADQIVFSTRTSDAQASGSVFVSQKGREAKADQALYDEKTEMLTLTGNVFMKKAQDWVSAEKITISVKDETFVAVGSVEAEFKL